GAGGGTASEVMTGAVRAYQDLDFDTAARLLRRLLTPPLANGLDDAERTRALSYLGAAEHYRGRPDSAIAVFRRLAVLAPRDQPDTLIFPPEVTRLYDAVRSSMADTVNPSTPLVAIDTAPPPPRPPPPPPQDGNSESRDLVEGAVALRFVGTPWLSVEMGPHARHYATQSGAERWLTWRLGGRVETAIVGTSVRGYAMLWRGLGLEVNVP